MQLDQVFERLYKSTDANAEYGSWIRSLPSECSVDDSIRELTGINLSDASQKYQFLYPLLKFHPKSD